MNRLERRIVRAGLVLGILAGLLGCQATVAPVQVETVGTLAAGPSVYSAPVHETTPPPSFEIAGPADDDATETAVTVSRADAGEDAAPSIEAKGQGLQLGGVR